MKKLRNTKKPIPAIAIPKTQRLWTLQQKLGEWLVSMDEVPTTAAVLSAGQRPAPLSMQTIL